MSALEFPPTDGYDGPTVEATPVVHHDLGVIIPNPKARRYAYAAYTAVSLVITNVAVGFAAVQAPVPAWLIVSLAVVGNLATPFGALAIANAKGK
jgi:hypothetical protein